MFRNTLTALVGQDYLVREPAHTFIHLREKFMTIMTQQSPGWPSKNEGLKSGGGRDNNNPKGR